MPEPELRGLPRIEPYALPRADELPEGRVTWELVPERAALLVHDVQTYFVRPFEGAPLGEMVDNLAALAERCRAAGIPVIYTAQPPDQDPRDRGLQQDFWGPGMGADPEDAKIVAELVPEPCDHVLTKWRYSAFQRTNLQHLLSARGRDQLIVTGVYAHIGCLVSASDAFMRDVRPFFVADGTADFSRAHHDMALGYVAGRCGRLTTTRTLLEQL